MKKCGQTSQPRQGVNDWYVADFETTSPEFYEREGYTRVWLYAISDSDGNIVDHGSDISQFMAWCYTHDNAVIYFHNLKFDGSFIIDWLLTKGYKHQTERINKHDAKGFTTLIDGNGAWYSITVNLARRVQVTFIDSLKIIPLKVKQIAKAFNLPIEKEVIDYDDYTIDDKRLEYVYHDVQIVAMALKFFKSMGYDKMTIGANAYNSFLESDANFKRTFPILDREWLMEWRSAYRGGRSQVNPIYAGKILHDVRRYDINSMYPYAMSRFPMPYGNPIELSKPNLMPFELYCVDIAFKLKKGHLPTLLKKHGLDFSKDTYYTETEGVERIYISSIDLELVYRHYDVQYIRYEKIYGFYTDASIFREWIDQHYRDKQNATGGLRMVYKLIINNLYGKFGSNPRGARKIPSLGNEGEVSFHMGEMEDMRIYYLPVAIAITSYCHRMIDDAILKTGYSKFVYCDTDSVHTLGTLPDDWVDAKEIGKFKLEATESVSKYVRQKCYCYKEDGKNSIVCCGMPDSLKDYLVEKEGDSLYNIFDIGLSLQPEDKSIPRDALKLRPKQVKGGCILVPTGFQLK